MIEFTKESYLICIIAGLIIYIGLLMLIVIIALILRGLKAGKFLKSRRFLFGAVFGIIIFPCLTILIWQTYLRCSLYSIVNNLKKCDRIEITLQPSLFFCLGISRSDYNDLFSFVDDKFLKTLPVLIVKDKNFMESFANKIKMAKYTAFDPGSWPCGCPGVPYIEIYKNERIIGEFEIIHGHTLYLGEFASLQLGEFDSSDSFTDWILQTLPETRPIAMRVSCAKNLKWLSECLHSYTAYHDGKYPDPNLWCDLIREPGQNADGSFTKVPSENFYCAAAGKGNCHYAINPFCSPDSPNDVVLLFETNAGWNQHGGSKLMAFDHHEPNGCNVLLNDGKIKFITPDKAADLKWKSK